MTTITRYQLFCLMMLFEIGSTTIFALGISAKQDAWIATIFAMIAGLGLVWIYTEIQKNFPQKNLVEILIIILGKPAAIPLSVIYGLSFFYTASFNYREFGELLIMTSLQKTPIEAILSVFLMAALFILFLGFEVLARVSETSLVSVLGFLSITYLLVIFSGNSHISELQPVFGSGITVILKAAWPTVVGFPFGEAVVFLMFYRYVNSQKSIRRVSMMVIIVSGLMLTFSLIIIISSLGADYAAYTTIPLIKVIKLIKIGDFLSKLDALGIMIIFIGGFFKMIIFFYASVLVFCTIFKIKEKRWMIVIIGIFLFIYTAVFQKSYPVHLWEGKAANQEIIYPCTEIYIPVLLALILWIKTKLKMV